MYGSMVNGRKWRELESHKDQVVSFSVFSIFSLFFSLSICFAFSPHPFKGASEDPNSIYISTTIWDCLSPLSSGSILFLFPFLGISLFLFLNFIPFFSLSFF